MIRLQVFYGTPADPAEFERRYHDEHVPLAWKIPNLRAYSVSRGDVAGTLEPAIHLVATLDFDDRAAADAALASPEAKVATDHAAEIATGGFWTLVYEDAATAP